MLMARPSPETLYTTVSVAPGVAGPVGPVVDGELGSVGSGKTGMVGRGVVVGVGRDDVGSGTDGRGGSTVSCCELVTSHHSFLLRAFHDHQRDDQPDHGQDR